MGIKKKHQLPPYVHQAHGEESPPFDPLDRFKREKEWEKEALKLAREKEARRIEKDLIKADKRARRSVLGDDLAEQYDDVETKAAKRRDEKNRRHENRDTKSGFYKEKRDASRVARLETMADKVLGPRGGGGRG